MADPNAPIGAQGIVTIIMLAVSLVLMAGDWVGPDLNFSTLMALYTACRFITVEDAAQGFGNTSLLAVMALYAAAEGVSQTGGLERVMNAVLGSSAHNMFWVYAKMVIPVMVASAFVNNTPIVALMIPILIGWSRRQNVNPKQLLLPLSYASILGGTCTLIGTSTNLVVAGFQQQRYKDDPRLSRMGIFDIAPYGLVYAACGFLYMLFVSKWLLPSAPLDKGSHDELLVGLRVPKGSKHTGRTVSEAGLRGLQGLFLVSVSRGGKMAHAVGPDFILQEDDILYFAGDLSQVELVAHRTGLQLVTCESEDDGPEGGRRSLEAGGGGGAEGSAGNGHTAPLLLPNIATVSRVSMTAAAASPHHHAHHVQRAASHAASPSGKGPDVRLSMEPGHAKPRGPSRLLKCAVKNDSPLLGMNIRTAGFRTRFSAAVVAVKRAGKRVEGRIGDIVLEAGDQLVLDTGAGFSQSSEDVVANFEAMEQVDSSGEKEFMSAFVVSKRSSVAGKSVQGAGLRGIPGLFLVYVDQADGDQLHAVPPDYVLQEGDVLWFAGNLAGVAFLLKMPGLRHIDEAHTKKTNVDILERRLVQVVVAPHSYIIGRSIKDLKFRTKYDAAIVAVQRQGERMKQKIGDIVLKGGDVLLLDTGSHFLANYKDDKAFALVSEVENSEPHKASKMWLALGLLVGMIATQVVQSFASPQEPYIELWIAAMLTSALMILTRCMSGKQARASMDWTVYMTIASAFGVSLAMERTNVSQNIGNVFISISKAIGGKVAIVSSLYIATGTLSEILTNNAAAALMYPIAATAGDELGVDPFLISVAIMLGASSAFMSPFGYQTNLMVYGAGQYKTLEFIKYGAGLKLWLWLVASVIMGLSDYISVFIGISLGGTALVLLVPLALEVMPPAHRERFYRWTSNCCRVVTCGRVYPGKGDLPLPQGIHP